MKGTGMTKILFCTCTHAYQTAKHGHHQRVHNSCPPEQKGDQPTWRCTVCGKERG